MSGGTLVRVAAAAAAAIAVVPQAAEAAPDRYALQGGCYTLTDDAGRAVADSVRFQATRLGSYLLLRPDGTFLAAGGTAAAQPSPAADWRTEARGEGFRLTPASGGAALDVRVAEATGCATFPEAPLDATGRPRRAATSFQRVGGIVEGHMHWMTYEYFGKRFHCGAPWHPYGIAAALPDCAGIEGPQGVAAPFQNFLNFDSPVAPHDTRGFPELTEFKAGNLTYEGTYWRWVERAYLGGMRLMVMGINENRILCELQANRETNCNEMDTLRRGFASMRRLQDYADAQAGGPGKGFFEIVTDPFAARRVINEGRMAVVLEIELSEIYDCRGWQTSTCTKADVDRQMDEMHRLGVRSSLLVGKFDNPLAGVRFDSGVSGLLTNPGNRLSAGTFWDARTCQEGELTDNTILTGSPEAGASVFSALGQLGVPAGVVPTAPPAPHCNVRGLTELGRHVVRRMMDLGWVVNPDHMSQAAVDETLSLLEARRYSAVISPHGWMDPGNWPRLWKLGGLAWPGHSPAKDYVEDWQRLKPASTPFETGWGYGADLGGLSHQPELEGGTDVRYPFRSFDGQVTFDVQRTGKRTFDYTKEGVATYGQYPEWFEDLRLRGGEELKDDLWRGAEAYLQMWERVSGVPAGACTTPRRTVSATGLGAIRLGADHEALLRRAGQPQTRTRTWTWCVRGRGNTRRADVAVLSQAGRVQLAGSTARGRAAGGVRVGAAARTVPAAFRAVGDGVRVRRAARGPARVVVVRGGRVRAVGVAARALARDARALRAAGRRLAAARADATPRRYAPSVAERERARGVATTRTFQDAGLAASGNAKVDAALAYLCRLQLGS